MRTILFISFLFFAFTGKAATQDSLTNQIFNLAYNMEYEQAEKLLGENKNNIDSFYFAVLEIDMSYWKNVTGTDKPNYGAFEITLDKHTLEQAQTFNQKGIQLIQLSYQLRYELKRFKLFSAISSHKKTKVIFNELKNNPQMQTIDNPDLFELYNSMFLYFSNYIKPFGGKSKDVNCKLAIATMENLAKSEKLMTRTLSAYFLGRTYLKYENTPELGIVHFKTLSKIYPGNTKFPELLTECEEKVN